MEGSETETKTGPSRHRSRAEEDEAVANEEALEVEAEGAPVAHPIRICVLGSEAAGKTCFLGGLAILSEPNRDSQIHVIGAEADTETTNGSPSQQFLNDVARTLRAGDWPPPTTLTREIELDIRFRDRLFKFDVIDYPGESFREALNQLDENRQKALIDHMTKADYLLLMLDPESDLPDDSELDSDARQHVHERQNAHIAGIRKIYDDAQINRRSLPHIGLVITKADAHPEFEKADELIAQRGANLLSRIKSWGVETRCFATSAVGPLDSGHPARELAPFGYSQIFDWIVSSTKRKRRQKWIKRIVVPAVFLLSSIALLLYLQVNRAQKITEDQSKPLETRVNSANRAILSTPKLKENIDALVKDQLGTMRNRFTNLHSSEELQQLRSDFQLLKSIKRTSHGREIKEFGTLLEEGDRKLRLIRINAMEVGDPDLLKVAQAFIKDYPGAQEVPEIEGLIKRIRHSNEITDREKVRRVTVQQGDLDSLNRKATAIMDYVLKHRKSEESEAMERAATVARRLANTNPLKVKVSRGGSFYKERKWALRVYVHDFENEVKEYQADGKVKRATWNQSFNVTNWKPGTRIRLEVEEFRFVNEMVAELEVRDLLSIRTLGQRAYLPVRSDFGSKYVQGHFEVVTSIAGFSDDDWKLLEMYVYPGKKW